MPSPSSNAERAAALRAQAARLLAEAQASAAALVAIADELDAEGRGAAVSATVKPPARRVPEPWTKAAAYIRQNPDATGDVVARAVGVSGNHFRKNIAPWLKESGFTSTRGAGGYHPPADAPPPGP